MDPEKFKDKTKKVAGTTEVGIVSIDYLSPKYKVEVLSDQPTTPTGLLEVARLNPERSGLPKFVFRWDESKDELDLDIYKNGRYRNDLWNKPGYKGHHTDKVKDGEKKFKADVKISGEKVFRGIIDVGLFIKIIIKESVKLTDSIKVVHKKVKIENEGRGINNIKINKGNNLSTPRLCRLQTSKSRGIN